MEDDLNLLADLVAFGDGGFFCNRIVTPIFDVMAYEVSPPFCCQQRIGLILTPGVDICSHA